MNGRYTKAQREHLARVKEQACAVCDTPGPSSAHHIRQDQPYTCVALCWECHQGPNGWHGNKTLWRVRKFDELDALNVTIGRLNK